MIDLVHHWANWLYGTHLRTLIGATPFAFPACEVIHVVGLTLVFGTVSIVDLRLMGLASMHRSVRDLARQMLPLTWVGFGIALISGSLLFSANAPHYVDVIYFRLKFVFIGLALLNMLVFHLLTWRTVDKWDTGPVLPVAVKLAGGVSLCLWITVIFLGRWVGFQT